MTVIAVQGALIYQIIIHAADPQQIIVKLQMQIHIQLCMYISMPELLNIRLYFFCDLHIM